MKSLYKPPHSLYNVARDTFPTSRDLLYLGPLCALLEAKWSHSLLFSIGFVLLCSRFTWRVPKFALIMGLLPKKFALMAAILFVSDHLFSCVFCVQIWPLDALEYSNPTYCIIYLITKNSHFAWIFTLLLCAASTPLRQPQHTLTPVCSNLIHVKLKISEIIKVEWNKCISISNLSHV